MVRVCRPRYRPTPCSTCTTGAPMFSSVRLRTICSGSITRLPLSRRFAAGFVPSTCDSQTMVVSAVIRPSWIEPTHMLCSMACRWSAKRSMWRVLIWCLRSSSSKTSRRPADSATKSTGPALASTKRCKLAAGVAALASMRRSGRGLVANRT